jgi:hypothetical protein
MGGGIASHRERTTGLSGLKKEKKKKIRVHVKKMLG